MRIHDSRASMSLLALNTCDCGGKYKVTVIEALTNDVTCEKCGTLMDSRRNNPDGAGRFGQTRHSGRHPAPAEFRPLPPWSPMSCFDQTTFYQVAKLHGCTIGMAPRLTPNFLTLRRNLAPFAQGFFCPGKRYLR